jgi:hypothetical protein
LADDRGRADHEQRRCERGDDAVAFDADPAAEQHVVEVIENAGDGNAAENDQAMAGEVALAEPGDHNRTEESSASSVRLGL